jgi:Cap4 dsDNA endonuclease
VAVDSGVDGLDQVPDPDDSGTDTTQRYRYQAEAAFSDCLNLGLFGTVLSITPERMEDLLIEEANRWRFVQIKTRDPGLNAFTFAELLGEKGALRSIRRTHDALSDFDDGRDIRYEIWLERGAKNGNAIQRLLMPGRTGADDDMVSLCAKRLEVDETFAEAMLDRCYVRAPLPSRDLIRDRNIRNLQRYNPDVSAGATVAIYEEVIGLVETAMRAELLRDDFPYCVMEPDGLEEALAQKVAGKRLEPESVAGVLEPLKDGNSAVLEQIIDPDQLAATELDRKLVAAGVTDAVRRDAKMLRANASRRIYELSTGLADPESAFEDLDARALVLANAVAGSVDSSPPGPVVYDRLLNRLGESPAVVDPKGLLDQDPMFLMGRVCDLSDKCRFGWKAS